MHIAAAAAAAGIDLLNHGGPATNGHVVLGKASWQMEGESAVVFVTTQHITAGQQVGGYLNIGAVNCRS